MTFALDLKKFAERAKENVHQVVRVFTLEVGTSVVERTPVGNPSQWKGPAPKGYTGGRLRANWQFTTEGPATSSLATNDHAGALSRLSAAVAESQAGGVTYLINNVVYAAPIEYEGHSKQAPAGMVRVTVAEAEQYLRRAVSTIKP
jgi:hypothetical protein